MLKIAKVEITASSVLTVAVPWFGIVLTFTKSQELSRFSPIEEYGPPNTIAMLLEFSTLDFNSLKIESIVSAYLVVSTTKSGLTNFKLFLRPLFVDNVLNPQ